MGFIFKIKMTISERLLDALLKKYESEVAEAEATLMIYFTSPVGIGEHPQHIEEMDKYVEKLTNAVDKTEKLKDFAKFNLKNGN